MEAYAEYISHKSHNNVIMCELPPPPIYFSKCFLTRIKEQIFNRIQHFYTDYRIEADFGEGFGNFTYNISIY